MTTISEAHRRWRKNADYRDAYDALGEEFDLARSLTDARTTVRLPQQQDANELKTSRHTSRGSSANRASID